METDTYYINGLRRQASAAHARQYLGIEDAAGNNLLTNFDASVVTLGYVVQTVPLWQDVRIPMSSTSAGFTNPAVLGELVAGSDIAMWRFSHLATQSVNFEIQVPHGVNTAYPIHLHVHWSARTPATNVLWGVTYISAALANVFSAPQTITAPADSTTQNYEHRLTEIVQIPITGQSQVVAGRLFRDSTDGFNDFVYGLSLDAHYVFQQAGSVTENP